MKRIAVVGLALALMSCGGGGDASGTKSQGMIASTAQFRILKPVTGDVVSADHIPVKLELKDARVIPTLSQTITPDTGHIHISIDKKTVFVASGLGLEFDLAEVRQSKDSLDKTPFEPGPLLLEFEFVAANHAPFFPRVLRAVSVTVK
jgi:hypothetical protein